ncbi:MAG TPA: glycosyl hydrolase family 18 protein [Marmoricola sp.]
MILVRLGAAVVTASMLSVPAAGATVPVLGFQGSWNSPAAISRSAAGLASVGVDGVELTENGRHVGTPDSAMRRQLRTAHAHDLPAVLLVSNFSEKIGDFSEPVAHRMLTSAANRKRVARSLVRSVRRQHWDGINVDLESLRPRDRAGLTAFVRELHHRLPPHKQLSIDLMNATSRAGMRAWGYNLRALGRAVDRVVLMGYDQHGPWEDQPGPVGALWWQRKGLSVLRSRIPAHKIVLGVAGYGYAWRPSGTVTVSDRRARALVAADGATAHWNRRIGEWTATLSDGSVLWWSDARSLKLRRTLARARHLGGLAVWDLALSDTIRS